MLILLALPVIFAAAAIHRYLQYSAPTNLLTRRVRAQEPRWRTVALLIVVAAALLVAMHALGEAVANGAPGSLNIVVLVLAWDAIKVILLALSCLLRMSAYWISRVSRSSRSVRAAPCREGQSQRRGTDVERLQQVG
jgi:branched-subunit amino acid ABC-type transport system permease component